MIRRGHDWTDFGPASKEAPNRRYFESIESIALNSPTVPTNGDTAGVPHVKTDLVNDLQCVSSNGNDPWFPDDIFTGGMVSEHKKLYVSGRKGKTCDRHKQPASRETSADR